MFHGGSPGVWGEGSMMGEGVGVTIAGVGCVISRTGGDGWCGACEHAPYGLL